MRYIIEKSEDLANFEFWGGAVSRAGLLNVDQFDTVENLMEEMQSSWSDGAINDFFWFEFDTICEWLGYKDEEHFEAGVSNEDIDEAQSWFEIDATLDCLLAEAGLNKQDYFYPDKEDEDYEDGYDVEQMHEDLNDWWNSLTDIEQVTIYKNN